MARVIGTDFPGETNCSLHCSGFKLYLPVDRQHHVMQDMSEVPLDPSYDRQTCHSMAELSLIAQLKSAASKTQEDAGILFSSDLVDAFLYDENPAKNDSVDEIISALDKNTSTNHHLLDTITLRCLAYILLNSGIEAGQERGLYILLVWIQIPEWKLSRF